MANLSPLTRKEQVLDYLRSRANQWVNGPELATEEVGGSEGLRRLRELRIEGTYDIRERRHPDADRDIWQYMLVVRVAPLELDFDDTKPSYPDHATEAARRAEELDLPIEEPEPAPSAWPADHGQTPISTAVRRKEDGTFEYVPPQRALVEPEQLSMPPEPEQPVGAKFEHMPKKLIWGEMAICPRCRQKTTRGRKSKPKTDEGLVPEHIRQRRAKAAAKEGPVLIDPEGILLYRDPVSKTVKPCQRCNGYGIVPNQGPVPITLP